MASPYLFLISLLLLLPASYANVAAEAGWLVRTWACQANFFDQLQTAQQNNPKAQVTAPKNSNDNDCANLQCVLKNNKQQQNLVPDDPIQVPNFVPCNTMANFVNKQSTKINPGQLCFDGTCQTIAQIANNLNAYKSGKTAGKAASLLPIALHGKGILNGTLLSEGDYE